MPPRSTQQQLELVGLSESLREIEASPAAPAHKARKRGHLLRSHDMLATQITPDDLGFVHSGLAQVCLPHARPDSNRQIWERQAAGLTLIVQPGLMPKFEGPVGRRRTDEELEAMYVGVPFGSRARLIMLWLQSEGLKSRSISVGKSMTAWMRALGLQTTGGKNGTIRPFQEQVLRVARATFTIAASGKTRDGANFTSVHDVKIADGLDLILDGDDGWDGHVELSEGFYNHLREHAVPLDWRGVVLLSNSSLGLDLYTLLVYRLPRLQRPVTLTWKMLASQLGSDLSEPRILKRKIEAQEKDLRTSYPDGKWEIDAKGLILCPSAPLVPRTLVPGSRLTLIGGGKKR